MSPTTRCRVFVPLTAESLRRLQGGAIEVPVAYAVTPALRAVLPGADEEDLEYAALCDAADACPDPGHTRRTVAAADVPGEVVRPDVGNDGGNDGGNHAGVDAGPERGVESLVRLRAPLALADVVSLHVGERGAADDEELSWYDVSELELVLSLP